jgi:cytochrome c553
MVLRNVSAGDKGRQSAPQAVVTRRIVIRRPHHDVIFPGGRRDRRGAEEESAMKRSFVVSALGAAALSVAAAGTISVSADVTRARQEAAERVARGGYLVSVIGCDDCHTPKKMGPQGPEPDLSRRLIGHPEDAELPPPPAPSGPWVASVYWELTAWSGPWGTSYAVNLTPDENTGIGIWTEEMFMKTLREGRHMGTSRPLLPPMPWQVYRNLTDDDLKAVFAYLRTLPPVHNRVPLPVPPAAP